MRNATEVPFCCPLCGSQQYETVIVALPSGATHRSSLFQCAGCTVVFRDREKFARQAKFEQSGTAGESGTYMQMLE